MKPFLIFDLDGTLIDSKADIVASVNATLAAAGIPILPAETIAEHVGTGVRPLMTERIRLHAPEKLDAILASFDGVYLKNLLKQTKLFPGMDAVLKHFRDNPKIVVTNKRNLFTQPIIDGLGLRNTFLGAFGVDAFPVSKPKPELMHLICEKFQQAPANTIVIGDTHVDMEFGRKSGARVCAVTFGYGSEASLMAWKPDFLARSAQEICGYF